MSDFHCPEEEISFPKVLEIEMNDNIKFTVKEYRDALYNKLKEKKNNVRK